MSAVRNTGNRRNHATLPYARPQAKKSAWSISGFLSSLNPFRSTAPENEQYAEEEDDELEENSITPQSPADHLSKRGHEISRQMNGNGSPALGGFGSFSTPSKQNKNTNIYAFPTTTHDTQSMDISPPRPSASPAKNIEAAKEFLAGKRNLNEAEVEGLRELLANTEPEENAPFRFTSTAPLSPDRGRSPVQVGRKTLPRNPNGTYRWAGAGSARRSVSRNRYSSPAFGPSRSRSERVILRETRSESDVLRADNKRRRVGEEADTSAASSSGATANTNGIPLRSPGPEPSPTRVQLAPAFSPVESPSKPAARAKSPAPHTPSRLRIPQKPTAPVHPSPLRQAWSGSPGSQTDGSPSKTPPTAQKQTKAANFMTELIKEVTPAKRPDLSNPYQTASPVKPTTHSKPRVTRRTRATGKPTAPAVPASKEKEEPEKTYSPQAIIEATLPKGSKRSRPPASLEKSTSNKANGHAQQSTSSYVVEEEDEEADDEVSPKKKKRPSPEPAAPKPSSSEVHIEVMDDEEPSLFTEKPKSVTSPPPTAGPSQSSTKSAFPSFKPTFAPKEPSKLRTSYQPDSATSSPAPPSRSSLPTDTILPPASLFGAKEATPAPGPMDVDPKEAALHASVASLPTYSFTFVATVSPTPDLFNKVKSMPASSLPTFDFTGTVPKTVAAPAPVKAFDFAAAGMKSANGSAVAGWTCSTCMLQNPASATEKCTVCDAPKSGATSASKTKASIAPPSAPTTGFNWGAAGIKPQVDGAAMWTCSTCMLQNPATATEKCTVCDATKEAPAPKPATQGFNWAAAGMAAPSASGAEWTCNSCMLKNPASATEKCTICDAKR